MKRKRTGITSLGWALLVSAGAWSGCPESGPTQAERDARVAELRQELEADEDEELETEATRQAALGTWPPQLGKPFPDLVFFDQEGKEVQLSTYKGKVILLQWAAATSPGSISQAGGSASKPFQGTPAQVGLWRLDKELAEAGVQVESSDLVWLQVLLYGPTEDVPTQEDARAWAKHFGLAERPRTEVLYGDERYEVEGTRGLVPGYFVIDRDFALRFDRTGRRAAIGYTEFTQGLKALLRPRLPLLPPYTPQPSPGLQRVRALAKLLEAGKFKELDAEVQQLVEQGYRKDEPGRTHLETVEDLGKVEGIREEHFRAWVEASPESFVPSYLQGMAHVHWGWRARGSGYASTVTEEGWEIFRRELQKAREAFTLTNRISSSQAYGYTGLLIVARALDAPEKVREAYFRAAQQADPDYLSAYEMNLEALYPKWGGSVEAARDFVYGWIERRPENAGLEILVPRLHWEFSRTVYRDGAAYLSQKEVVSDCVGAIRRVREAYPNSKEVGRLALRIAKKRGEGVLEAAKRLAEQGDSWGMGQYGYFLKHAQYGAKQDLTLAHRYLVKAAWAGDLVAAGQVAQSLSYHPDFEHDFERAVPYLLVAARQDYVWAQTALGDAYYYGRGVERDLEAAAHWYARSGTRYAKEQLEEIVKAASEGQPR